MISGKPEPSKEEGKEARRKRITSIKEKIKAGTYDIDPAEISRKIVDAHLSGKKPAKE